MPALAERVSVLAKSRGPETCSEGQRGNVISLAGVHVWSRGCV